MILNESFRMALPSQFKRVLLNLARSKQFPEGSNQHGYEFIVPLDANGHIDTALWRTHRGACRVHRFWQGEDEKVGQVVHKPGDQEHDRWIFDYYRNRVDYDEAGYRSCEQAFIPGEYVTIGDQDDATTFRVVAVEPAA
jgi:hypothetical protein